MKRSNLFMKKRNKKILYGVILALGILILIASYVIAYNLVNPNPPGSWSTEVWTSRYVDAGYVSGSGNSEFVIKNNCLFYAHNLAICPKLYGQTELTKKYAFFFKHIAEANNAFDVVCNNPTFFEA